MVRYKDRAKHLWRLEIGSFDQIFGPYYGFTKSRTMKRTKKVDAWLLKAIHDWHNCVGKGQKHKKVKTLSPSAPTTKVVIVPFDCEQGDANKAGDGGLTFLGIEPSEINNEVTLDDSDDESEATDPKTGGNPPLGPNQGSNPVQLGNPAPPAGPQAGPPAAS